MIPQANPGAGYRALKAEIDAAVARALASGWYILGGEVRAFEAEFAAWLGAPRGRLRQRHRRDRAGAARAWDRSRACTVVTVSHTAVATVAAIEMAGATPLLIDIDPVHYTMDPDALQRVLEEPPSGLPPIKAVMPVHLYGQPADLDRIVPLCRQHTGGADRGLRAGARCAAARPEGRHFRRSRHLQLLSDQEPRRAGRRRRGGARIRSWRHGSRRCGNTAGTATTSATKPA